MEVKDTSKPKKASVRFASTERDPVVNVITSSTVDLKPVMKCLQDIKGRMGKMERRGQPARASTPPSRPTSPAQSHSEVDHQHDRETTTPATSVISSKTNNFKASMTCLRRTILPVYNHAASRYHRSDGTTPIINL